jgi:uncharacterized protein (TIGR03083 family)
VPTTVPKEPTVAALHDVWGRLDTLLAGLSDDEWKRPTSLPGWNVQAVAAHLIGTESMLLGVGAPELTISEATHPHVRNDIGSFNEAWVEALAAEPPAAVLARFRADVAQRKEALDAMTPEEWDKLGFTPAGQDTYGRFMQIRVFDQWMHELDIRDAIGLGGGDEGPAAEVALAELAMAMGYLVGKKAGAPQGSRVHLVLTGPVARTIDVEVGERAAVVDALSGPPTLTVTVPAGVFARLAGGRADPETLRDQATLEGDVELGERLIANLAYTI